MTIKYTTAVLCGQIEVPTLNGKAKLNIPSGTKSHTIFKLKGMGIKKLHSYSNGDQYIRVIIEVPKHLSKQQKKLLEELDKSS